MKSPRHRRRHNVGFRMLSKEAQERLVKYEYAVIWLMVLIAITSIVWSISLHIVSGDFNNGIIGAKLDFQTRDFHRMDKRAKEVFYQDLGDLINRTYTDAALEQKSIKTTVRNANNNSNNNNNNNNYNNSADKNNNNDENENEAVLNTTEDMTSSESTTAKPKRRKIEHLFRTSSNMHSTKEIEEEEDDELDDANATNAKKPHLDVEADRKFLSTMVVDVENAFWRQSVAVQFVYSFPFLTEIMAIIWTAMCLIFQSGVKKYWGLPKPWRIVVPSIFVFTLMTLGTMIYMIITNRFLKLFCTSLKAPLSDPDMISCGEAMSVLRPIIKRHQFRHDIYLNLFRVSYILSFLLWAIALVVMVLRFVFAIDFQLVDVRLGYQNPPNRRRSSELSVVRHKAQSLQAHQPNPSKLLRVDERSRHKSEDDFQSAKSNISEAVTPLLDKPPVAVEMKKL